MKVYVLYAAVILAALGLGYASRRLKRPLAVTWGIYAVFAVALGAGLAACATTTSPTGRTQYMAYSDSQLNQMGAQAFAEMKSKQKTQTGGQQSAYVQCVVKALVAQLPPEWRQLQWETAVFVDEVGAV